MTRTISILWVQIWTVMEKTCGTMSLPSCSLLEWLRSRLLEGTGSSQPSEAELKSKVHHTVPSRLSLYGGGSLIAVTVLQQSVRQNVMNNIPLPIFVEMCDPHLLSYIF